MSDVIDRPLLDQEKTAKTRLRIIDCDVHPSLHSHADLNAFLPKRWQEHLKTYGSHLRTPYIGTTPYPRSSPLIARRDALPPPAGRPDPISFHAQAAPRSARCRIRHPAGAGSLYFLAAEPRIRRGDPARHQRVAARVLVRSRPRRRPRSWPDRTILNSPSPRSSAAPSSVAMCRSMLPARQRAARPPPLLADLCPAQELGLPLGIHVGGYGGHAPTGGGWPSYYVEEHDRCAFGGGGAFEPGDRRRAGTFPAAEDRVHRRRVRLDSRDLLADGPAFRSLPQRGAASQARRRNM